MMTPNNIPNRSLLKNLAQTYFRDSSVTGSTKYMSSYWMEHTEYSTVEFDDDGNPISLVGGHFGGCKWNGLRSRVLDQLCVLTHLAILPQKLELIRLRSKAAKVCKSMDLDSTIDVFRQICSLEVLKRHLPEEMKEKRMNVMIIGDGFGILGALFKAEFPNSTIIMVDIGRTLTFQAYHLQLAYPKGVHEMAGAVDSLGAADFVYCPAEDLEILDGEKFDIATSVGSMHEMTEPVIARYFDFMRRNFNTNNLFYCANRVHKVLPAGEISAIYNYPWDDEDEHFLDEGCGWSKFFFFGGRAPNAPKILGVRLPIIHPYDGPVAHRLTKLALTAKVDT
jgi:hypothetical protein